MIDVPAGAATLGHSRGDPEAFGWDNEFEVNTVHVPAFAIDNHKVTNRLWLAFVNAGGYQNRELWTEPDWAWRSAENIESPVFWNRNGRNQSGRNQTGNDWSYCTMFREVPLHSDSQAMDWPVYVSHAEASAYARWAGKSLPTEAEWHRAAFATPDGGERNYPWGNEERDNGVWSGSSPSATNGNFDFASWDPTPVGAFPEGASAFGVDEMIGNGWEWTSTKFAPFPGFKEFSFYPGYSANFFDGKHYVMKGGSPRTAACMLRPSFRNWFQPYYPYVYATFRCVED